MRSKLYGYILNIWNRVPSFKQIWQKIKKHPIFRNSTNANIHKSYEQVKGDKQKAKDFNKAPASTKLDSHWLDCAKRYGSIVKIDYHFNYDFPEGSRSGKVGKTSVHETIDIPAGSSKSEANALIREKIRDWMMNNYGTKWTGSGSLPFTVDLVRGC